MTKELRMCLRWTLCCTSLSLWLWATPREAFAQQANPPLVISQVYGGGNNGGAPYRNDFIEIFNRSAAPVSLNGLSLQYTSASASSANFGANPGLITVLGNVVLQPGQYYLVQEAGGTANGVPLPAADQIGVIALGASAGKVALVNSASTLGCNGGTVACSAAQLALIVDLVGYGTGASGAAFFEGASPAPTLSNTLAAQRGDAGCADTNSNGADFSAAGPSPRNSSSPLHVCGGGGGDIGACGDPATNIGAIQGPGAASPMVGATVNVEGVVTGDYQDGSLNGFYLQQPDGSADGNALTSDGIFVFEGGSAVAVTAGSVVRVRGQVAEFSGLTELTSVVAVLPCGGAGAVSPAPLAFPVAAIADLESYEGMLVHVSQTLTVTGNFELGRFGSLDLSAGGRLFTPTSVVAPGAPALALQAQNDRSRIVLDDASSTQNPDPIPYKDANQTRRVGDTLPSLTGILDDRFGAYRIHPTVAPAFVNTNPRPPAPAVGGRLKVVAMNVLNFFSTVDSGPDVCGPSGNLDCRGADSASEYTRQLEKLVNAIGAMSPDIAGLMEIENNASASLQALLTALDAALGAGTYAYVNTGVIGTDAIKLAFIYKPATVELVGAHAVLTSAVNPLFLDNKNRPALAQTFREKATGAKFTVIANHLKSKGSDCDDVGDPDLGDGQGNCNLTRSNAADALISWIGTDPTGSGDPDYLLIGDFNAYGMEDPIEILKEGMLTSLVETFVGPAAYSYQFDGQSGYLDSAFATGALADQVTGVAEWHANADEPVVLDYNLEFKTDDPYSGADPYRASDHDPLVIGLNPTAPPSPVPAGGGLSLLALVAAYLAGGAALLKRR